MAKSVGRLPNDKLKKRVVAISMILRRARMSFEILGQLDNYLNQHPQAYQHFAVFFAETWRAHSVQLHISLAVLADRQKADKIGIPWLMEYARKNPDQFRYFSNHELLVTKSRFPNLDSEIEKLWQLRSQWFAHINELAYEDPGKFFSKWGLSKTETQEMVDGFCAILNEICGCRGTSRLVSPTCVQLCSDMQELLKIVSSSVSSGRHGYDAHRNASSRRKSSTT